MFSSNGMFVFIYVYFYEKKKKQKHKTKNKQTNEKVNGMDVEDERKLFYFSSGV